MIRMDCGDKTILVPWSERYPSCLQSIAHEQFHGTGSLPVLVHVPDGYAEQYLYPLAEFSPACHSVTARAHGGIGCIGSLVFLREDNQP